MNDPRANLRRIIRVATELLERFDDYETTEAAIAHSAVPATGGGTHGGDIPDPIYATRLAHQRWDETCLELAEARGHLLAAERNITTALAEHPETARHITAAVKAARCSELNCTELAVKDGLCFRHFTAANTTTQRRHA